MADNPTEPAHAEYSVFNDPKLSLFFGAVLFAFTAYFIYWGLGYTGHNYVLLFVLATLFGVFMAFNIGGNDVANSFGTSVGAGTLTIKQALLVAAVFEVSGAIIAGGDVTETIRGEIVDLSSVDIAPLDFIFIMMSALVAGALWLLFATHRGWPVSTAHSVIGAMVGSSITLGIVLDGAVTALALVQWAKIGQIAVSWVLSPLLGCAVSYLLYSQIKTHILSYNKEAEEQLDAIREQKIAHKARHKESFDRLNELQQISYTHTMTRDMQVMTDEDFEAEELESEYFRELRKIDRQREHIHAHRALENWVPLVAALGGMIIAAMLLFKGLNHLELGLSTLHNYMIMAMVGAGIWMAVFIFAKTLKSVALSRSTFLLFSWMQVFTAAGFAFSHGSNDIANAIGPFAAILDVMRTQTISQEASIPLVTLVTFGVALVVGLWFIGKHVIATVGTNLTKMHPASGFAAELSASAVIMAATLLGLPVSSTHILIGAVVGIGLVNHSTNWRLIRPIAMAWVITLPAAAVLSAITFMLLRTVF